MRRNQKVVLGVCVVLGVWVTLSVLKIHIDVEIVPAGYETKHSKHPQPPQPPQPPRQQRPVQPPVPDNIQKKEEEKEELVPPYQGVSNLAPYYVPWSDYDKPYSKDMETKLHETYRFNKYLSDRIPLNRDILDTRPGICKLQRYSKHMGKVSVVLIYYNEAVAVVMRTVISAINRSPPWLLYEFVLYDDGSDWDESIGPMKAEVDKITAVPIRYYRNTTRGGLMRARTYAAKFATGDIMVYLDSHCEVSPGWLEPLIEPIYKDRTAVTCPVIDTIEWESMRVNGNTQPMNAIGSFNILLNYNWYPIPEDEQNRRRETNGKHWPISPIRSPAMAGGLFAINRGYFHELGEYDTQMNVWGGENTEISIRIWTCGGSLLFTPCSKVGHIFRHGYPYDFQGDHFQTVLFNYKRVAKVWLDDDEEFYYKLRPMARHKEVGSVDERKSLRKNLQCKSYDWYVQNIGINLVSEKQLTAFGQMRNGLHTSHCIDNLGNENKGQDLGIGTYPCHPPEGAIDNQFMMVTKDRIFRSIDRCLSVRHDVLYMHHCFDYKHDEFIWEVNKQDNTLKHIKSNKCLDATERPMAQALRVMPCNGSPAQQWTFTYYS